MPAIGEPRWRAAGTGHVVRVVPGDVLATVLSSVMPALLTRMSRRPWRSMNSRTVRQTVIPARDIALMDTDRRAVTGCRQLGEELLRLLNVPAVPRGYRCSLTGQAFTDRRTDSAGTTRHESNAPTELSSSSFRGPAFADLINRRCRRHDDPLAVARPIEAILVGRNLCRLPMTKMVVSRHPRHWNCACR